MASEGSSSKNSDGLVGVPEASEKTAASPDPDDNLVADEQSESGLGNRTGGRKTPSADSLVDRIPNLLRSVSFGIVLLALLIVASMIGDIYLTVFFNLMVALLGINFILVSIDHLPGAWNYIFRKQLTASPTFAMAQDFKEKIESPILGRNQLVERAAAAARAMKFTLRITPEMTMTTIFAERSAWNRLGSYALQVALLTILVSSLWDHYRGYTGWMWIEPEKSSDKMATRMLNVENAAVQQETDQLELRLPFTVEGLDIQQKLINENLSIDPSNTVDWITRVRIHDHETRRKTEASIRINNPFDYRGYRFFQISFSPMGNARTIRLKVAPAAGGASVEVTFGRNSKAKLSDGTQLHYFEFNPSFSVNADQEIGATSYDYINPAAHLAYLKPGGEHGEMWAFTPDFIDTISNVPNFKSKFLDAGPYRLILTDFEKVSYAHMLSIQYYPGTKLLYVGCAILGFALIAIFFFSHQRLWIVVEDGNIYLGGNTNRNRLGFEARAKKVITLIREPWTAENRTIE
jgi:cytochrome c biogenesis protein